MLLVVISKSPFAKRLGKDFAEALRESLIPQNTAAILMGVPESHITEMTKGERPIRLHEILELGWDFFAKFWPRAPRGFMDGLIQVETEHARLRMAKASLESGAENRAKEIA